ncbi:precorrin-6y C5,15-methyltransferase (decarboxylating) subunit CbiE [Paracoccus aeridis]|uniref:precorrin-6y C5,15-methyltransferase (decarboxylating) subunit CbiE n=1 Tax=Paracoccus aeridis TaxID=1966466 RepID=UPI0010AA50E9|nr:precorrin-6y C5,15-methyltransferase (decarboxylating) subunit CbiE [Paracoccus aeridis]
MSEWLSIIGIGENGLKDLAGASREALDRAEVVFGSPRHLALVDHPGKRPWPVPFSLASLLALRGRPVAALVSGDPFWHGAGGSLAQELPSGEWRAYPGVPVPSLVAARLGWRLEEVTCLGLHAAPLERLRRHLTDGARLIVTLRDGAAPSALAGYLTALGFGSSVLHVMEHLGGPRERIRRHAAHDGLPDFENLVACAIEVRGGKGLPQVPGLADDLFDHDGQITKRPIRALALSALAPRAGELLWDLGAGSGSVGIEWLLSHPRNRAVGVERDPARAARARANALSFGVAHFDIREGAALELLPGLPTPDAVFIGGGLDGALLDAVWAGLPAGTRIVAHGVTLETESLLAGAQARLGGTLLRIELSQAAPLGGKRGWKASHPVVQWSVMR